MSCNHCNATTEIRKITVPIERKGKIVNFRKVQVCPRCIEKYYPEHAMEPRSKMYKAMIRGKETYIRGRT
ncbi:MAG: hypothetical protein GF411_03050 [Candidatus Lokiarchaeota archaeon]|nr:hypothetical protein [Candidatus Lokiarchaeota archaeon]